MFRGFNLEITKDYFKSRFEEYKEKGETHLKKQKVVYESELQKYITDTYMNGSKIQDSWFPQIDADIFISHSHDDKELAWALAGWINEVFCLKCFIDSNVWGYSANLLKIMNSKLSNERKSTDGGYLYDYKSCNQVSEHVNNMLSIALQKMIDKTEAIILLNTENSIQICTSDNMNLTYSPWIYSEIICTQIVRKKPLIVYRDYSYLKHSDPHKMLFENVNDKMDFIISYTVPLTHLIKLTEEKLLKWYQEYNKDNIVKYDYSLDALYRLFLDKELGYAHAMYECIPSYDLKFVKQYYSGISMATEETEKAERIIKSLF